MTAKFISLDLTFLLKCQICISPPAYLASPMCSRYSALYMSKTYLILLHLPPNTLLKLGHLSRWQLYPARNFRGRLNLSFSYTPIQSFHKSCQLCHQNTYNHSAVTITTLVPPGLESFLIGLQVSPLPLCSLHISQMDTPWLKNLLNFLSPLIINKGPFLCNLTPRPHFPPLSLTPTLLHQPCLPPCARLPKHHASRPLHWRLALPGTLVHSHMACSFT